MVPKSKLVDQESRSKSDACHDIGQRMIADHAAAAIAADRAFAAINAQRKRLESEDDYRREEANGAAAFGELIGQSPLWKLQVGRSTWSPHGIGGSHSG
jgi:transcriptional regulator with GAF, ATPase, and Fis domain